MSALTDRIAEVLRAHLQPTMHNHLRSLSSPDGGIYTLEDVAERIEAELQSEQNRRLIEAWRAGFDEGMKFR